MAKLRCVRTLIVLAKAPRPGLAKTRLAAAGDLSLEDAAKLARAFLVDTLATCRRAPGDRISIGFTPADARAELAPLSEGCELFEQPPGELGERIDAAFAHAIAAGARRIVVIGSDTPHIGVARLAAAFERLETTDLVLGPARDGGYYLIALRARCRELFEGVAWSTRRVLEQTLANAARAGLRVAQLDELDDIDGAEELASLAQRLALEPQLCPATAAALVAQSRS